MILHILLVSSLVQGSHFVRVHFGLPVLIRVFALLLCVKASNCGIADESTEFPPNPGKFHMHVRLRGVFRLCLSSSKLPAWFESIPASLPSLTSSPTSSRSLLAPLTVYLTGKVKQ